MTASLRPGLRTRAFVFNTLLQDKATKDRLRSYPHWLASRNLANEAERRVGASARRRRAGALRPGAPLVHAQGAPPGPRPPFALRPHGAGVRKRRPHPVRRGRGDRARPLPHLLPGARRRRGRVLHGRSTWTARPPRQARRRVLLVHRALRPSVRDAQLHVAAARRADDGARARPRGARRARAAAGHLPLHDPLTLAETASIFGENIVLERLLERAPGPAERSTCSRARSTARWPPSSGRSR